MPIVFDFPPADVANWGTYNVTFLPDTSELEKEKDKTKLLLLISEELPPDPENNILKGDLISLDDEHSQLLVNFLSPEGNKVTRGAVRPPAVNKPPASRVVSVTLVEVVNK
jgi:hypothetical protein